METKTELQKAHDDFERLHGEALKKTQNELVDKMIRAEAQGALPKEAMVLTRCETIIVWGDMDRRSAARKKWTQKQARTLPDHGRKNLKDVGRCHTMTTFVGGDQQYVSCECSVVKMTQTARKRLEGKVKDGHSTENQGSGGEVQSLYGQKPGRNSDGSTGLPKDRKTDAPVDDGKVGPKA